MTMTMAMPMMMMLLIKMMVKMLMMLLLMMMMMMGNHWDSGDRSSSAKGWRVVLGCCRIGPSAIGSAPPHPSPLLLACFRPLPWHAMAERVLGELEEVAAEAFAEPAPPPAPRRRAQRLCAEEDWLRAGLAPA